MAIRVATEISGPGGRALIPDHAADPDRIAQAIMLMVEAPTLRLTGGADSGSEDGTD
jgi:hypothetical protein